MKKVDTVPKKGTFMGVTGVKLYDTRHTFSQESDTWQSGDEGQEITIRTHNGGDGAYITLETKRWAIDPEDIDAFCACLKRICDTPEKD